MWYCRDSVKETDYPLCRCWLGLGLESPDARAPKGRQRTQPRVLRNMINRGLSSQGGGRLPHVVAHRGSAVGTGVRVPGDCLWPGRSPVARVARRGFGLFVCGFPEMVLDVDLNA